MKPFFKPEDFEIKFYSTSSQEARIAELEAHIEATKTKLTSQIDNVQFFHGKVEKLEQVNKDDMIKTKAVIDYCYNHLEQMWAARVVSLLLGCDFRDAKLHADKFNEVCEENGL